jgi:hypothetical protein
MTLLVLLIIVAIFIGTIIAFRVSWPLALTLLFLAPFIATNIVLLWGITCEFANGEFKNASVRDVFSFTLMFYLFTLPYSLYPGGLCLALIGVMSKTGLGRSLEVASSLKNIQNTITATACGAITGTLFALFFFLIGGRHSYSFALPITILTGTIDGLVIALFGQPKMDPTNSDDTQRGRLSVA